MRVIMALAALALAATVQEEAFGQPAVAKATATSFSPQERSRTINQLADALSAMYVTPDIGRRYAAALRANLARGAYNRLTDQTAFAAKVKADLQAVAPDLHLRLLSNEVFARPPEPDTPPKPGMPEGVDDMRMMGASGEVAYLRFTAFPHNPATAPAVRAFLLRNAGKTKAVVLDARPLHGGGIEVMDAILPLFFAERTVLASLDTRSAADKESPFEDGPTLVRRSGPAGYVTRDHVVKPDPVEARLRRAPLYYLTSAKTASAGEHLALVLKRTKRATLIGETTRGAGHYGALVPVGTRLTAFVPVGRAYDPETGQDWEGRGVTPNIAVPANDALDAALRHLRRSAAVDVKKGR